MDAYNTFLNVAFLGALLLSPVSYPMEEMPAWFQTVALSNPLTWSVDLLRAMAFGALRSLRYRAALGPVGGVLDPA